MVNGVKGQSGVGLEPVLFSISLSDADEGIKNKVGGSIDLLEAVQRDLARLDQWVEADRMRLNKANSALSCTIIP